MLGALKEQAEDDDTSIELPEYITNSYTKMLSLGEEDLAAIEAAAEERRRHAEIYDEDEDEEEIAER